MVDGFVMTPAKPSTNFLEFWYLAMASKVGIIIETSDRERAKQALYRARVDAMDDALSSLTIMTSPMSPNQLWIVKKAEAKV